jgi:hypothetical protein
MAVTHKAMAVTHKAMAVTHKVMAVTHKAMAVTHKAMAGTHKAMAVTHKGMTGARSLEGQGRPFNTQLVFFHVQKSRLMAKRSCSQHTFQRLQIKPSDKMCDCFAVTHLNPAVPLPDFRGLLSAHKILLDQTYAVLGFIFLTD